MISICIPIYNYDVTSLVVALNHQIQAQQLPIEIILIDDGSTKEFRSINERICSRERYIKLTANIGRARIRNRFLQYATQDYLLFLDCDSSIPSIDFLNRYLIAISNTTYRVVCGGTVYTNKPPNRAKYLRWRYGMVRESKAAKERMIAPNTSFMTNNFLIHRNTFAQNLFDERLAHYGHEDTLLGYVLKRKGILIHHINNPVLHQGIEKNIVFLKKTEKSIANLRQVLDYVEDSQSFMASVRLLRFYEQLRKKRLLSITSIIFNSSKAFIRTLLIKGFFHLYLFDFYKLGMLIEGFCKGKEEKGLEKSKEESS